MTRHRTGWFLEPHAQGDPGAARWGAHCGHSRRIVIPLTVTMALACGAPETAPHAPRAAAVGTPTETPGWLEAHASSEQRLAALRRLTRDFEALHTADPGAQAERELVDRHVGELTDVLVRHGKDLDPAVRKALVRVLVRFRDRRAEPAYRQVLADFVRAPAGVVDAETLSLVFTAQRDLGLSGLVEPVFAAYQALAARGQVARAVAPRLLEALLVAPDPGWTPALIDLLAPAPQTAARAPSDSAGERSGSMALQAIACRVLGMLGASDAARPLLEALLDPARAELAPVAFTALTELGAPATEGALEVVRGDARDLVEWHRRRATLVPRAQSIYDDESHLRLVAPLLGASGTSACASALLAACSKVRRQTTRAVLWHQLARTAISASTRARFREGVERISAGTRMPDGRLAVPALLEASERFRDPDFVPWLLRRAARVAGTGTEKLESRSAAVEAILRLATTEQLPLARRAVADYGTRHNAPAGYDRLESPRLEQAESLLLACGADAECYLERLTDEALREGPQEFTGIKAAFMIGVLGDARGAERLAVRLAQMESRAVQVESLLSIDHLLEGGSAEAVRRLTEQLDRLQRADGTRARELVPLLRLTRRRVAGRDPR